jgi:hypothetical protein
MENKCWASFIRKTIDEAAATRKEVMRRKVLEETQQVQGFIMGGINRWI